MNLIKNEYYRINPKGCWDFFKKRDKRIPCLPTLQKRFNKTYNEILIMVGIPEEELNFDVQTHKTPIKVKETNEELLEKCILILATK